ncbi:MAG: hypothetical protein ACO288_06885, partial [Ilumatobacteraceae bacterium]
MLDNLGTLAHTVDLAPITTSTPDAAALHWLHFDAEAQAIPPLPEQLSHVLITLPPDASGSDAALQHLL